MLNNRKSIDEEFITWEKEFEMFTEFKKVFSYFIDKLYNKFPNLNKNDVQIVVSSQVYNTLKYLSLFDITKTSSVKWDGCVILEDKDMNDNDGVGLRAHMRIDKYLW